MGCMIVLLLENWNIKKSEKSWTPLSYNTQNFDRYKKFNPSKTVKTIDMMLIIKEINDRNKIYDSLHAIGAMSDDEYDSKRTNHNSWKVMKNRGIHNES
jgi:hypothetical protein